MTLQARRRRPLAVSARMTRSVVALRSSMSTVEPRWPRGAGATQRASCPVPIRSEPTRRSSSAGCRSSRASSSTGEVWGLRREPRARLLRAARRPRRAAVLDVALGLRAARHRARRRAAGRRRRRLRLLPRQRHLLAVVHVRGLASCGSPARATCWWRSSACAGGCTPTACSSRRSGLPGRPLPRTIGVVCGERGKARDDVLAGLRRRGWRGRLVWAFAPVQDRHAAPRIAAALRELAAIEEVEVVIVARGGGSLADLFAFCDEALCRTVALLRVPVISSVGHHTDRTLIDDVAAVCCSTPTHAAEAAVPIDCRAARADVDGLCEAPGTATAGARSCIRARALAALSRAPARARRPPPRASCISCCASCGPAPGAPASRAASSPACTCWCWRATAARGAVSSDAARRRARRSSGSRCARRARSASARSPAATRWSRDRAGEPLASAAAARRAGDVTLRFHDGASLPRSSDPEASWT